MNRRITRPVRVALALAAIGSLSVAPASTAVTPSDRIVYARLLDGGGAAIYTAKPDGTNEQLVPLGFPAEDFGIPTWSPDHTRLLIANTLRFDANGELLPFRPATVRPDGSDYHLLEMPDAPSDMYCVGWSPDGSRIVCGFGGDEPGLFTVRTSDGGDPRRLTTTPDGGNDQAADVSPDGMRVLFIRKRAPATPGPHPFANEQFALYDVRSTAPDFGS